MSLDARSGDLSTGRVAIDDSRSLVSATEGRQGKLEGGRSSGSFYFMCRRPCGGVRGVDGVALNIILDQVSE